MKIHSAEVMAVLPTLQGTTSVLGESALSRAAGADLHCLELDCFSADGSLRPGAYFLAV